jgi:hypothetical protein
MKYQIIVILLLSFTLFQCKNIENKPVYSQETKANNSFVGTWTLLETKLSDVKLEIKIENNSTFTIVSNQIDSCKGIWEIKDTTIILNTDSSCCSNFSEFVRFFYDCEDPDSMNKPYSVTNVEKVSGYFIFFDNEEFFLKEDSLIYIHKDNTLCKDSVIFIRQLVRDKTVRR